MAVSARVNTASGQEMRIAEGTRLVFGRGPEVDLAVAAGPGLSRRAGVVTALAAGAWITNISRTHALYVEGEGYRIRLPRLEDGGEPAGGWLLHWGTARVGSRSMLDEGRPLQVTVASPAAEEAEEPEEPEESAGDGQLAGEGTILPLTLDPMTKGFLVALIWCRPWLMNQSPATPLPRTPEIARAALEVTGAYHQLERFETDAEFRDLMSARVAEHVKVLRRKITVSGLATPGVRLSDEMVVRILIEHGAITSADLGRLADPVWRSRQEDLWWTED
jgi:hypothetical protein